MSKKVLVTNKNDLKVVEIANRLLKKERSFELKVVEVVQDFDILYDLPPSKEKGVNKIKLIIYEKISLGLFDFLYTSWKQIREDELYPMIKIIRTAFWNKECLESCHSFIDDNTKYKLYSIVEKVIKRCEDDQLQEMIMIPLAQLYLLSILWTNGIQEDVLAFFIRILYYNVQNIKSNELEDYFIILGGLRFQAFRILKTRIAEYYDDDDINPVFIFLYNHLNHKKLNIRCNALVLIADIIVSETPYSMDIVHKLQTSSQYLQDYINTIYKIIENQEFHLSLFSQTLMMIFQDWNYSEEIVSIHIQRVIAKCIIKIVQKLIILENVESLRACNALLYCCVKSNSQFSLPIIYEYTSLGKIRIQLFDYACISKDENIMEMHLKAYPNLQNKNRLERKEGELTKSQQKRHRKKEIIKLREQEPGMIEQVEVDIEPGA